MGEIVLKNGSTVSDARLGRVVHFDERSRNFRAVAGIENYPLRSYSWSCNTWLDQGYEGSCVGHAWAHELAARPAVVPVSSPTALGIYHRAQQLDPWEGEAYEGTSVLAGAKATMELTTAKGKSVMESYRWTFSTEELIRVLGYKGCGVLGLGWYSGMFNTDVDGFIRKTGSLAGGHAILARGFKAVWRNGTTEKVWNNLDLEKSYVLLRNSWGKSSWGIEGDCKINLLDLDALLHEQGESCVPTKRNY